MDLENSESAAPLPPTFETTAPLEAMMYPRYSELEEEEEYILHRQPEATTGNARAEVHWDEASSTDGEESEEESEMTEDEDNVELSGRLYQLH